MYIDMSSVYMLTVLCYLLNLSGGYSLKYKDYQNLATDLNHLLSSHAVQTDRNICCANGQWEANAFLDYGAVLSIPEATSFFHYNGTGRIAFDDVNKKSFISFNITAFSPQVPVYSHFTTTTIKDFAKGIMYEIDDDGHCMKDSISRDMQLVCVPGNVTSLSVGGVGTEVVSTYQFSAPSPGSVRTITASVLKNGIQCVPVTLSQSVYAENDVSHGTVFSLDIMDVTFGIKDPSIFVLPKSCDNQH
ncbi:uncharacterized protein LOC123564140 isoform X1 [Mercenaria mercenaria]|uniref:uncharacterized protein LOC123564140 isoform X1 n=1 Tax=Mercenaria mercenaria TaxID=6596 RepID=UPI00234E4FBA|nr:uncharacterized protein LOC123564140 isoform X1 [Mercenaria mercenaria]